MSEIKEQQKTASEQTRDQEQPTGLVMAGAVERSGIEPRRRGPTTFEIQFGP
jgi:hypothetical protein